LTEEIVSKLSAHRYAERIEIVAPESVDDYIVALSETDGIVASRFHALIMSLIAGRPCFGVYFNVHGHKVPGLMDLLGERSSSLDITKVDIVKAAEQALETLLARPTISEALDGRIDKLRRETRSWLAGVRDRGPTQIADGFPHDVIRALKPLAIRLSESGEQLVRSQLSRLAGFESRFNELNERHEAVMSENRGNLDTINALQQQISELTTERELLRDSVEEAQESLSRSEKVWSNRLDQVLSESKATRVQLTKSVKDLEARFVEAQKHWSQKVDELEAELKAARDAIAARERDLVVVRSQARRDRRHAIEVEEENKKKQDLLKARISEIEESESFRIGYALVRVLTLPRRVLRRMRTRQQAPKPASHDAPPESKPSEKASDSAEAIPQNVAGFESMYTEGGAARVIKSVVDNSKDKRRSASLRLIEASKLAAKSKFPEAEYEIVYEALRRDRSDQTLRAMYWTAQRTGNIREAWNVLAEIEQLYGKNRTDRQDEWLTKARNGPIMNIGLLDEIVIGRELAFEPVDNRLCYVLHNSLPYSSGGYATRAHGLVTGLRSVGIETICITRPGYPFDVKPDLEGTELPDADEIDNIQYHRLWEPKRGGNALSRYVRGAADAFERKFRLDRPAIVIAASAHLSALPALIAARRLGLPFIYEVRGFWEITRLSREPEFARRPYFHVQKLMEAEVANASDHVFTLTAPMKAELVERGVPAEKISLLPNSCNPERFLPRGRDPDLAARLGIPGDVPVIGYIGTFVQYEGLDHLAEACAILRTRGLEFRLLLVGNEDTSNKGRGPITERIEQIAHGGGFADWLIMPGRVPHDEVEAYYSLIDIAPFPRKPQPVTEMVSPMKPLEALAMEKAVVVSSVRALVEFISHGETGVIFDKGNVTALADALSGLVGDSAMRKRLGKAAREWVIKERTWSATADRARQAIGQVIKMNPASVPATASANSVTEALQPATDSTVSERDEIYRTVREMYAMRDKARKKPSYSVDDWERTRLVFELLEGATSVVDIGIGQAQLTNLLARCTDVERLYGYDFRDYATRIDPPPTRNYQFKVWDITKELDERPEAVDIVVAMEVLEHIDVKSVPDVFARLRSMSSAGAMLITVPYQEKEPLYHHDRKHGHKQSFDDAKLERIFGPCLYSHFKQKWYFIFVHDSLSNSEALSLDRFCEKVHALIIDTGRRTGDLQRKSMSA